MTDEIKTRPNVISFLTRKPIEGTALESLEPKTPITETEMYDSVDELINALGENEIDVLFIVGFKKDSNTPVINQLIFPSERATVLMGQLALTNILITDKLLDFVEEGYDNESPDDAS